MISCGRYTCIIPKQYIYLKKAIMTNMKRTYLLLILLLTSFVAYAQRDIEWFNGKTPEQIISEYGTPTSMNLSGSERSDFMCDYALFYPHFEVFLNKLSQDTRKSYVDVFATDSPDFVVLSNVFPGGIRVGGRIRDLQSFDFSATPAGRNKQENNLQVGELECGFGDYPEHYSVLSCESQWVGIDAENGIIKSWALFSKPDDTINDITGRK